jgi:hypothetical protein
MSKKDEKVVVRPDEEVVLNDKVNDLPKFETKPKSVVEDVFVVSDVVTQTERVIFDKKTKEQIDLQEAVVLILNKLDKIEKILG